MARQLSKRGAAFSAAHEACYLYAYPDPGTGGDPWTAGIGHTSRAGPPTVKRGDRWTLQKCFEVYRNDGRKFAAGVDSAIRIELKQHEFDALFSLHLNTGAVKTGTVDDKLNAGQRAAALATWRSYNRAGGKVMQGLVNRRAEEIALFQTGNYPSRKILLRETPGGPARYILPENIPWADTPSPGAVTISPPPAVIDIDRPLPASPAPRKPPAVSSGLTAIWEALKGIWS